MLAGLRFAGSLHQRNARQLIGARAFQPAATNEAVARRELNRCALKVWAFAADKNVRAPRPHEKAVPDLALFLALSTLQPMPRFNPLLWLLLITPNLMAAEPAVVRSPDGTLEVQLIALPEGVADTAPGFLIRFAGRELLRCDLGLSAAASNLLSRNLHATLARGQSDSTYNALFGKANPVRNHYHELTLDCQTTNHLLRNFQILFRVYDDGVAFRYSLPKQDGTDSIELTDESDTFHLSGDPQSWPLFRENYTTSHEGLYSSATLSQLRTNELIDLPFLMQYSDGTSLAITEANLRNYAGMYLKAGGPADQRALRSELSPLPGQTKVKVRSSLPLLSPWRVILVGASVGKLIESNMILNLNDPSVVSDTSWIRLGKSTWYWWNGPYQEPVDFKCDLNWETMKHYIDFCASNNITFHSVMSTVDEFPWYYQTRHGYGPAPDSDVTRPRPGVDIERIVAYAKSKNVGIRLWVHWKALSDRLEAAFTQYEKWGIAGLMVDFLDRDDQEMVLFAERVLQSAARHHLHIHFHGVWKPTGLQRTYPNLFNHEGVLNLEYLKWGKECSPEHNVTVPFTRMLAGPMDYHLGGFRAANLENFKAQTFKPMVLGTRCHHLAMYVVFENPMPMVCDAPTAYQGQPGFDFIREVPTTWNETRVLQAKVGNYVAVARRADNDWYIGAMTDWNSRQLEIPLNFLKAGRYQAQIWADAPDSADANQLTFTQREVGPEETLTLQLTSGGGQAIRIHPVRYQPRYK
jgi:alpha-glucosidase